MLHDSTPIIPYDQDDIGAVIRAFEFRDLVRWDGNLRPEGFLPTGPGPVYEGPTFPVWGFFLIRSLCFFRFAALIAI